MSISEIFRKGKKHNYGEPLDFQYGKILSPRVSNENQFMAPYGHGTITRKKSKEYGY